MKKKGKSRSEAKNTGSVEEARRKLEIFGDNMKIADNFDVPR